MTLRSSITMRAVTRLAGALLAAAGLLATEAEFGPTVEAAPCLVLHLTSLEGPSRLDGGATGTYTLTVTNPNAGPACDGGLQVLITTVGSLRPTGTIAGSTGVACTEEPPGPFAGRYRCFATSLTGGATATIAASIRADDAGAGRIDAFAWALEGDAQPPHGHPYGHRELAVNRPGVRVLPTVRVGATGETATTIQYLLRHHGADVVVDGDFGDKTEQAVRAFQRANGLAADGMVGPRTWAALFVTVREGDQGDAVRAVQSPLAARGIEVDGVLMDVDGDFGHQTEQAVRKFQEATGLTVDGIVGPQTWTALVAEGMAG